MALSRCPVRLFQHDLERGREGVEIQDFGDVVPGLLLEDVHRFVLGNEDYFLDSLQIRDPRLEAGDLLVRNRFRQERLHVKPAAESVDEPRGVDGDGREYADKDEGDADCGDRKQAGEHCPAESGDALPESVCEAHGEWVRSSIRRASAGSSRGRWRWNVGASGSHSRRLDRCCLRCTRRSG